MTPTRISILAVAALTLLGPTTTLDAQVRVGGGAGSGSRGGVRAGGIGSSPGSIGSAPQRGTSRGVSAAPSSVGGSGTGTLHPRGYLGSEPSSTNAPFPTVPSRVVPSPTQPSAPQGTAQSSAPRAAVRRSPLTPTVITVPRAQSIPRMRDSIPPLERPRQPGRAHIDPAHVRGFRGVDYGSRRAPGFPYRFPVVYLPFGYGYGNYATHTEQIVIVDHNTATQSSADVERVAPAPLEPRAPLEPQVVEIQPREDTEIPPETKDPASVEVIRGNQASGGAEELPVYLLARKDETIVRSRGQWLSGNTVHYITPAGEQRRILIENLDLDLTARLNNERGLSFTLEVVPAN